MHLYCVLGESRGLHFYSRVLENRGLQCDKLISETSEIILLRLKDKLLSPTDKRIFIGLQR